MKLWIALCGGIVLEEAFDLSLDRLLNNDNNNSKNSQLTNFMKIHQVGVEFYEE
jgi:hypothetical protein